MILDLENKIKQVYLNSSYYLLFSFEASIRRVVSNFSKRTIQVSAKKPLIWYTGSLHAPSVWFYSIIWSNRVIYHSIGSILPVKPTDLNIYYKKWYKLERNGEERRGGGRKKRAVSYG